MNTGGNGTKGALQSYLGGRKEKMVLVGKEGGGHTQKIRDRGLFEKKMRQREVVKKKWV